MALLNYLIKGISFNELTIHFNNKTNLGRLIQNNFTVNFNNWNFWILGGAFDGVEDIGTPFGYKRGEGINEGHGEPEWIVNKYRSKYDDTFERLGPLNGKISGEGTFLYYNSHKISKV